MDSGPKVEADKSFKPQEYNCISKAENSGPTKRLVQKTFLRSLLFESQQLMFKRPLAGKYHSGFDFIASFD